MPRDAQGNLELEIQEEKAATLARIGNRMEEALQRLRDFEAALQKRSPSREGELEAHQELIDDAAEKVWFYVVQREALGLIETTERLRDRGVPAEVLRRMGPRKSARAKD